MSTGSEGVVVFPGWMRSTPAGSSRAWGTHAWMAWMAASRTAGSPSTSVSGRYRANQPAAPKEEISATHSRALSRR